MDKQNLQKLMYVQQQFLEMQEAQERIAQITDCCWDKCMGVPGNRLETKTENCFRDCTQRLVDSSTYITNRFSMKAQQTKASSLPDGLQ